MSNRKPIIVINGDRGWWRFNFKELWHYKDLFLELAYRDLRVRYAQTFLGLLWVVLQPITTLLIFTLIFGRAMEVDTGGIPYPVFALAGMSAWNYFSFVMTQSASSIIGAQEMVKKIYFPRLVLPLSKAFVGLVDFGVAVILLFAMLLYYGWPLGHNFPFVFVFALLNLTCSLAIGIWISALSIRFRDFQHVVPFMVQIGLYATPIAYPSSMIPERYQLLFHLNPMAGIVEGMRWSLLGSAPLHPYSYLSFVISFLLLGSGLFYFRRLEKIMADIV